MAQKLLLNHIIKNWSHNLSMLEKFNKFFIKRVIVLFILFFAVNIVANLASLNIFVDILSHFKVQYFYISFLFLFSFVYLCFVNKKFIIGVILSFCLVYSNYSTISPYYKNLSNIPKGETLKVGLFNVLTSNKHYDKLLDEIKLQNPDIVILQEVDNAWVSNIQSLKKEYPYYKNYPREDNFGISLYSKIPLKNIATEFWDAYSVPVMVADTGEIKIYCTHTLPPASFDYIKTRNKMLQRIGEILGKAPHRGENVLVAGDLNTTSFSKAYRLANPSLNSYPIYDAINYIPAAKGTWNAKHPPFFRITLEHILTTENIVPTKTTLGNPFGSDHLPVFAEFIILK